jgi:cytochrome c-type biogenesis protein CcsB
MTNINFEIFLANISFVLLFLIMILYWIETIFSLTPKFNSIIFLTTSCANLSLLSLLIIRWVNYGHFPLSNLYESLLFLSWSFTLIELFFSASLLDFNFNKFKFIGNEVPINENLFFSNSEFNISNPQPNNEANLNLVSLSKNSYQIKGSENLGKQAKLVFLETDLALKSNQSKNHRKDLDISLIIGTVISPIALFTNSFAAFSLPKNMQKAQALVPALQSNWLMMHVTVMMLSYTALLCGSLLAISFLIITWHDSINQNKKSNVLAEPCSELLTKQNFSTNKVAQTLDNLSYRILGIGFPLLTIGILSGAVWANEAWGSYWSWDPKETWAFITWLVFAIYLHARITKGWQGKKPAILASFGFFIVWICYLGVNILGTGLHSYGWIELKT